MKNKLLYCVIFIVCFKNYACSSALLAARSGVSAYHRMHKVALPVSRAVQGAHSPARAVGLLSVNRQFSTFDRNEAATNLRNAAKSLPRWGEEDEAHECVRLLETGSREELLRFIFAGRPGDRVHPLSLAVLAQSPVLIRRVLELVPSSGQPIFHHCLRLSLELGSSCALLPLLEGYAGRWHTLDALAFTEYLKAAVLNKQNTQILMLLEHFDTDLSAIKDEDEAGPLHWVAYSGASHLVELLMSRRVGINDPDIFGRTPLYCGIVNEQHGVVKALLKAGASVQDATVTGMTPLHAAMFGPVELVSLFLSHNANIHATDVSGYTPIFFLGDLKNEKTATDMLHLFIEKGADLTQESPAGNFLFESCLRIGFSRLAQEIIDHGFDVNALGQRTGLNALHKAACQGDGKLCQRLVNEFGADFNVRDAQGNTVIHLLAGDKSKAYIGYNEDMCPEDEGLETFFFDSGVPVDAQNKIGETALHKAVREGNVPLARMLLAMGANRKIQDNAGQTPFKLAVSSGQETLVNMLFELEGHH